MMTNFNYNFLTSVKVYFGAGKLNILHTLPISGKALVIISNGKSTRANGYLDRVLDELKQASVEAEIFDGIQANPTKESVEAGAKMVGDTQCNFIVALGGGSVLDAAKVIAMKANNPGDLWDYAMSGTGGRKPATGKPLHWIAIPTTAGTGSEVDAIGVITNLKTKEKLGMVGPFADYAIVDPELMLSVPPKFTAYQGFDALFHSLEGYISKPRNIFADMIQEAAITNVARCLPAAFAEGSNIEARSGMAFASTMSGYSMVATSCTGEHSIEHALSAYHEHLPHGAGLIMISRAYFSKIISQHVADERFVQMARWMGRKDATRPEEFIDALLELQRVCKVDDLKMSEYGIDPSEFPAMAENAVTVMARCAIQDIQPLTTDEIVEILKASYK